MDLRLCLGSMLLESLKSVLGFGLSLLGIGCRPLDLELVMDELILGGQFVGIGLDGRYSSLLLGWLLVGLLLLTNGLNADLGGFAVRVAVGERSEIGATLSHGWYLYSNFISFNKLVADSIICRFP